MINDKIIPGFLISYSGRKRRLLRAISSAPFFRGGPRTGAALKYVKRTLFRSRSRGRRQILCVITHGKSYDSVAIPAAKLRRAGVEIIGVGAGQAVNVAQLRQMVGKRHGAVFTSSFRTLLSIAKAVEMKACRGKRIIVSSEISFCCNKPILNVYEGRLSTLKILLPDLTWAVSVF